MSVIQICLDMLIKDAGPTTDDVSTYQPSPSYDVSADELAEIFCICSLSLSLHGGQTAKLF